MPSDLQSPELPQDPEQIHGTEAAASSPAPASAPSPFRALLLPLALATLSGALIAVGFLVPAAGLVAFVAFAPLTLALRLSTSWKQALLLGWWAGFVFHIGAYHWFVTLLQQFGRLNLPLAVGGTIGFAAAQGSLQAFIGVVGFLVWRRGHIPLGWAVLLAVLVAELLYPTLFPSYLGNHLAAYPRLTQTADLGGAVLVSALAGLVGAGIEELVGAPADKRPVRWLVPTVGAVALLLNVLYGSYRLAQIDAAEPTAPTLRTAIVQANVGAADKHLRADEGIARFRTMTDALLKEGKAELVVWPESAYNRTLKSDVSSLQGKVATDVTVPMIVGAVRREQKEADKRSRRYWNTALALAPGGDVVGRYDKSVLLAFGEYIPGSSLVPGLHKLLPFVLEFESGTSLEPLQVGPYRLSTNICYEDIIAAHVRDLMGVLDASGAPPHAMVNLTNDSWYGPVEPPIHLALATFRAIEHRRWMIRSTATGISAFVDPAGRVRAQTAFERAEVLEYDVPMITGGRTPYSIVGPWPAWLALAVTLGALAAPLVRRRAQGPPSEAPAG